MNPLIYERCHDPPQRINGDLYRFVVFGGVLPPLPTDEVDEFNRELTSAERSEFLKLYPTKTILELADHFYITNWIVEKLTKEFKARGCLPAKVKVTPGPMESKPRPPGKWTPKEDAFLRENYPLRGGKFCSAKLGRTNQACISRAATLLIIRDQAGRVRGGFKPLLFGSENLVKRMEIEEDIEEVGKVRFDINVNSPIAGERLG